MAPCTLSRSASRACKESSHSTFKPFLHSLKTLPPRICHTERAHARRAYLARTRSPTVNKARAKLCTDRKECEYNAKYCVNPNSFQSRPTISHKQQPTHNLCISHYICVLLPTLALVPKRVNAAPDSFPSSRAHARHCARVSTRGHGESSAAPRDDTRGTAPVVD